jgi:hypothetical protein
MQVHVGGRHAEQVSRSAARGSHTAA